MKAYRIIVVGLVQGVGFRPFVHRIALASGVRGFVRNVGGSEVEIFIEGEDENVKRFFELFSKDLPPPARIEEISIYVESPRGYDKFIIEKSSHAKIRRSMIPPDLAVCEHCLREVLDPKDRRYRYAFNSCAWCGPRFSMMYRVPYDRENTAMAKFPLCEDCLKEYLDVYNVRRYHAQGISCPRDGPKLELYTSKGERIEVKDAIRETAKLLDEGYIVAIKGIGGYHIAALASDDEVVLKLRKRKRRPQKPFAVMALDIEVLKRLVILEPSYAIQLLESPQRPIVLLPKRDDTPVSPYVSPGMDVEGVFLPYTPLHYLILMETRDRFLIMTSGNIHGEPMCIDEECVFTKLKDVVDYVLVHNREIVNRVDDSVIRFTDGEPVLLRRARGYAPTWIRIDFELPRDIVAFGAELQAAGAIGFEDKVVLTQFVGDVDNVDTLIDFDKMLRFLIDSYSIDLAKAILVVDKHPRYLSRELALDYSRRYGSPIVEVQHHYAHIMSVIADRGIDLDEKVLGIAIDGVGYGDDGAIWGGELILVDGFGNYVRVGHLEYMPFTSDRDTFYPTRFLIGMLTRIFNEDKIIELIHRFRLYEGLPAGSEELFAVLRRIRMGSYVNTSSTGRVLDAISALLGICRYRSYEGEPAIKLEAVARKGRLLDIFDHQKLVVSRDKFMVKTSELVLKVLECIELGYNRNDIALSIQIALGRALGEVAKRIVYGKRGVAQRIVLSGGAAVNSYIVRGIKEVLREEGIEVVLPRRIPPNDGGIALGQVYAIGLKMLYGDSAT